MLQSKREWQDVVVANATVPILELLSLLGIFHQGRFPCQIKCPVHGDRGPGTESHPSARVYADNFVFCFFCGKQYRPVEIAEAHWGGSAGEVAARLLQRWPPSAEAVQLAISGATVPEIATISHTFFLMAEKELKEFRGKVSLDTYSSWAKKVDGLLELLLSIPKEDQKRGYTAFVDALKRDLQNVRYLRSKKDGSVVAFPVS